MLEKEPNYKTPILPYQQVIFDRLCATARAVLCTKRSGPIRLKNAFMLLGGSGLGKTFLVRKLAKEMGSLPFLSISVSDWLLLGGRGTATWPAIFDFIERSAHHSGAILFVDEFDKCGGDQSMSSSWCNFLKCEVFTLLDSRIPFNINDLSGDPVSRKRVEEVQRFLENRTMIVAGAAFQEIWEERVRPSVGFVTGDTGVGMPDWNDLVRIVGRETMNRFSSELFILPELTAADYRLMVDSMAGHVDEMWRAKFRELGHARIPIAVEHRKGARYMEEVLLAAIMEERASMSNFVPSTVPSQPMEEKGQSTSMRSPVAH
jgi:hypothetical protein